MKLSEIHIRDPFILPFEGKYYLFGTPGRFAWQGSGGFWCNISEDLKNWSVPIKCFDPPEYSTGDGSLCCAIFVIFVEKEYI